MKFIPVELRRLLPEFSDSEAASFPAAIQNYRRYYQLDIEHQITGVKPFLGKTRVAGFEIVVHRYTPGRPIGTVFVVHGYYDHVGLYQHLIKALLKQGYVVVAFDLPGHGLSSGTRGQISSFRQYLPVFKRILQLAEGLPKPWHVVAQSTGGAIVTEYLLNFAGGLELRIPFRGVVFYAPLVRPVHWAVNARLHTVISPFRNFVKRKFARSSNDADFLDFVKYKDPLQPRYLSAQWVGALKQWIPYVVHHEPVNFPLFIIQGKSDETVDWEFNIPVLQRLFINTQVIYMANVRHHVVNELELYRKDVFCRTVAYLKAVQ